MKNLIMVCVAHSDDEAVGAMGTLLKYREEGKHIVKVVFSKGQSSHPHLKEHVVVKERKKETAKIDEVIGIKETIQFDLEDTKLKQEIKEKNIKVKLKELIEHYTPEKIFLPSVYDVHPDHRAVNKAVRSVARKLKQRPELYAFEVWGLLSEPHPYVYVDITPYFKRKVQIMQAFESQWLSMYMLLIPVFFKARFYGFKIGVKYAEKFYKL